MKNLSVKLHTNRITVDLQPIIDYAVAYNLKHGISLTFTTEQVDVTGYTSSNFQQIRTGINYCILLGSETLFPIDPASDINIFVFDQNEWKTPPGSPYPLLPDTPTSDTIIVKGKPYINLGIYTPQLNASEIVLCHELIHAYAKIAVMEGFSIVDNMDQMTLHDGEVVTYYLNSDPNAVNGNFENMWEQFFNVKWLV